MTLTEQKCTASRALGACFLLLGNISAAKPSVGVPLELLVGSGVSAEYPAVGEGQAANGLHMLSDQFEVGDRKVFHSARWHCQFGYWQHTKLNMPAQYDLRERPEFARDRDDHWNFVSRPASALAVGRRLISLVE